MPNGCRALSGHAWAPFPIQRIVCGTRALRIPKEHRKMIISLQFGADSTARTFKNEPWPFALWGWPVILACTPCPFGMEKGLWKYFRVSPKCGPWPNVHYVTMPLPKRQNGGKVTLSDFATNFGYSFASTATIDLKLTPGDVCDPASQVSVTACHFVAPNAE